MPYVGEESKREGQCERRCREGRARELEAKMPAFGLPIAIALALACGCPVIFFASEMTSC